MEENKKQITQNKPKKKSRKFLKTVIILGILFLAYYTFYKGKVGTNEIGLLISKIGTEMKSEVKNGFVFNLPSNELIKFPTDKKLVRLTENDKTIVSFRSKDRILLTADIYFECNIIPAEASDLYLEYKTDFWSIVNEHITQNIRDEFVFQASKMESDSILDNQKLFIDQIESKVIANAKKNHLNISKIGYLNPIMIPENLKEIVEEIIFSKELTQKAKIDRDKKVFQLEESEAENKRILDSVITFNMIRLHSQMTNNELRINQFKTDSSIYSIKYTSPILEAMRIENFTKAIEKWNGQLPSSSVPNLEFPFEDSKNKIDKSTNSLSPVKPTVEKPKPASADNL